MIQRSRIATAGTAAVAVLALSGLPAAHAAHPVGRAAAPVITVKMTTSKIALSSTSVRAGRVTFQVTTHKGNHTFQLLRLHTGYTIQQAGSDIPKAFKGDTDAIARVDKEITWLGGAVATPSKSGSYQVALKAGQYVAVDQNGNGLAMLTVKGSTQKRTAAATHGQITALSYGFRTDGTIRANGWVKATNRADQPHFVELQQVKPGTTRHQIQQFFNSGGHGRPSWALRAHTDLGVISPGKTVAWSLDLPKGEYVMMCFWPDIFSGMPHAALGMFDLTHLK